jgi:hypothetical protein
VRLPGAFAGGAQQQDRAPLLERVGHRHEVVLAAHAGHDPPVLERVGHRCAQRGHHHAGVEEAGVATLQPLEGFVAAVEFIDPRNAGHADARTVIFGQFAQPAIKVPGAKVERRVQPLALARQTRRVLDRGVTARLALHEGDIVDHAAANHAGIDQVRESVGDHLAGAEQSLRKRIKSAPPAPHFLAVFVAGQGLDDSPVRGVVGMAKTQSVAERVAQCADADLQGAAIANQGARVQSNRVFGIVHRFPDQRERRRHGRGMFEHGVEELRRHRRLATQEGQVGMHDGDQGRPWLVQHGQGVE